MSNRKELIGEAAETLVRKLRPLAAGRLIAFGARREMEGLWGLTLCIEDIPGNHPVPIQLAWGDETAMRQHADDLNRAIFGMMAREGAMIVASSMAGEGTQKEPR
jgi:hypothetical protein